MHTLYIYDAETLEVIAEINGPSNDACEDYAALNYGSKLNDEYSSTYSPAFGFENGLMSTSDAEIIDLCAEDIGNEG